MKNIIYIGIIISVFFAVIGTASAVNWTSNSKLTNGITDGVRIIPAPFVNITDNSLNLIIDRCTGACAEADMTFDGYTYNGTGWETNNNTINGLTGIHDYRFSEVFYLNGNLSIIMGDRWSTNLYGYTWNGTGWETNDSIIAGLPPTVFNYPSIFTKDGNLSMIAGCSAPEETPDAYGSNFFGYTWNGSSWLSNQTLVKSLYLYKFQTTPSVFNISGNWYAVVGDNYNLENLHGYEFNGTDWLANSSVVKLIYLNGTYQHTDPKAFHYGGLKILIGTGYGDRNIHGFDLTTPTEVTPTSTPIPVTTSTPEPTPTPDPTVSSSSSGGSSSSSGGGGGGGSPSEPYKNVNKSYKVEKYIYHNIPAVYDFSKAGMLIFEIDIASDVNIPETEIKIEELKNTSTLTNTTPLKGATYYNVWINTKRFKNATIKFDCNSVTSLLKWNNGSWEQLSVNNGEATTNTLSTTFAFTNIFAIVEEKQVVSKPVSTKQASSVEVKKVHNDENILKNIIDFIISIWRGK